MTDVVSCILQNQNGKILILKRSDEVKTYKGFWSAVAGYVEKGEKPIDTAYKEIGEEVGLKGDDIVFLKRAKPVEFTDFYEDEKYNWTIFPFLFKYIKGKINIDWEHTEYNWIDPEEIVKFKTVPHLKDIISKLL